MCPEDEIVETTDEKVCDEALCVIDIQNDFCQGGALEVPGAEEIIPYVNQLIRKYTIDKNSMVFITGDSHPEETKHFDKWPVHCVNNTFGSEEHPDIVVPWVTQHHAMEIRKGMSEEDDGYSAFEGVVVETNGDTFDVDAFLRDYGFTKLYIVGLATDHCVVATALDGIAKGYFVTVDLRGCRGVDPQTTADAIKQMDTFGVTLIR